ncbi:MAG TPA: STAS domain-containing protein [Roseiflexaceae bacterium]|nr:STAS domain-containing protein [Roseiflexaceae bacterium]
MNITQRQSGIFLLALQTFIAVLLFVGMLFMPTSPLTLAGVAVGALSYVGLLAAYVRGWEPARLVAVLLITALTAVALPEPYVSQQPAFSILIGPVLALVLTRPIWVVVSTAGVVGALLIRSGGQGVYTDPMNLVVIVALVGGMILARLVTETAQREAHANARRAEEERGQAERRAAELDVTRRQLEEELERQRSLLALVDTLETPAVRLADGVLFAPVVGHVDSRRADALTHRLLEAVHAQRARMMIIDIAGVAMVDTGVAAALLRTVQALRMLGCQVVVSGIAAPVASSLVDLGASLGNIRTVRSPEEALALVVDQN